MKPKLHNARVRRHHDQRLAVVVLGDDLRSRRHRGLRRPPRAERPQSPDANVIDERPDTLHDRMPRLEHLTERRRALMCESPVLRDRNVPAHRVLPAPLQKA